MLKEFSEKIRMLAMDACVCYVIMKSSIKIHIPGQDGDFRKYTGSLANFIVQNHTYNAEMSLQLRIHNCKT